MPQFKSESSTTQLGENLRWLMKQHQLNQNQLARVTKVNQPIIHRILTGQNVAPRETTVSALARHFSLSSDDLLYKNLSDQTSLPQHLRGFRVPVYKQQEIPETGLAVNWPLTITVYYQVSNRAYAVVVEDDSMKPEINVGDIVVVEPDEGPTGEIVLAKVATLQNHLVVIRQYKAVSYKKGLTHFILRTAEESDFPSFDSEENKIEILGVVVARWERKLRR